jgi:hypothetical protein
MEAQDYTIKYPLDAVHVEKFAELIGKPKTAVEEMIKARKLPVIELRDPTNPTPAQVSAGFISPSLIAQCARRTTTAR